MFFPPIAIILISILLAVFIFQWCKDSTFAKRAQFGRGCGLKHRKEKKRGHAPEDDFQEMLRKYRGHIAK